MKLLPLRTSAVVLGGLLLVSPALAADRVDLSFSTGFHTLHMMMEGTLPPSQSVQLRAQMDGSGNRDGQVTQDEVDQTTHNFRDSLGGPVQQSSHGNITLDARMPDAVQLETFSIDNALGPVMTQTPVVLHFEVSLNFTVPDSATHTLTLRGNQSEDSAGDDTDGVIHAPPGFLIQSTAGITQAVKSDDGASVSFHDAPGNHADGVIVFVQGTPRTAPSAAPALLLAVLVGAAVARRGL